MDLIHIAVAVGKLYTEAEEEAAQLRRTIRKRKSKIRRRMARRCAIIACLAFFNKHPVTKYAVMKNDVPIISIFCSEADMRPAFRLSRNSFNMLVQLLPRQKPHGWSHEMEVLVTVYWLACGASYRVTADVFAMPLATICRMVHNVVEEMMTIIHRIIHFPKPEEMEEVGAGFAHLAGHEALEMAQDPGPPHNYTLIEAQYSLPSSLAGVSLACEQAFVARTPLYEGLGFLSCPLLKIPRSY
uniref:uncharacterized protein LOC120809426 n=1 Tax=Gasterosteus aculeatus aculeatus TaxID=481459 RepID=UPI001A983A86|nr:uncharacterized protein LOC120809426 [Gasterosteus aculeatus aculeatus]